MFINLTPHEIVLKNSETTIIPPSGNVARCAVTSIHVGTIEGIQLCQNIFGEVEDLPSPVEGTIFLVSALVRLAVPTRKDVASPGDLVRDDSGKITGCRSLIVN